MKISKSIFLFSVLNLIGTIIFIYFLPSTIVFDLTFNMNSGYFTSKWCNIVLPSLAVVITGIIVILDIYNRTKIHKYRYFISWLAVCVSMYYMWIMMLVQYRFELCNKVVFPWSVIVSFPFAFLILTSGMNDFSKNKKEFSIFKASWVKNNLLIWKKTHYMSGVMSIIVGLIIVASVFVYEFLWNSLYIFLAVFGAWLILHYVLTIMYSYCLFKKYGSY